MKILHLKVSNIFGARYIDLDTMAPIQLFAGRNGAGKSSIREGVMMAFSGDTTRVKLKRDYGLIVSEGAKEGMVVVTTDEGMASITMPKGAHAFADGFEKGLPDALPYVLDAQRFAKLKEDDRRTFLFGLTNSQITEQNLRRMLKDAGCDDDRVAKVMPLMKSITGFPAAAKFAAERATEAKGAWQGITGERYGSKKGESWEAEAPEFDADAIAYWAEECSTRTADLNEATQALGALKANAKTYAENAQRREVMQARAARVPDLQQQRVNDELVANTFDAHVRDLEAAAGEAPKQGPEHDFARAVEYALDALGDDQRASVKSAVAKLNAPYATYIAKYGVPSNSGDEESRAKLPLAREKAAAARRALQTTSAALRECEAAQAALEQLGATEAVSDADIAEGEGIVAKLKQHQAEAQEEFNKFAAVRDQAESAGKRTTDAKAAHDDVLAWDKLAEQLGADGIPAQILAKALKPINTALRAAAMDTGWRQASINADMSITAEGRLYDLLCESEQWRVDAMIAEAIASLSEVGVLVLDRVDVLEIPARVELLMWLHRRAESGAINTALLFATLKALPTGVPPTINAVWLENGEIAELAEA